MRPITAAQMQRIRNGDQYALTRKLTEREVREIRAAYGKPLPDARTYHPRRGVTMLALARRYGVNHRTISSIISGRSWKHVR